MGNLGTVTWTGHLYVATEVTLSDETLNPCCQWPTPKFIPQPRAPAGTPRNHRVLNPFQQERQFLGAREAGWHRGAGSCLFQAARRNQPRRRLAATRRASVPLPLPTSLRAGPPRGSGERQADEEETREERSAQARGAPPPQRLLQGGRRGPSHFRPRRLTAPALASPRRPGVRVLPPACRPGASACQPAAALRGPGSRSRCRPGRRGRGQPLPLPHLPRPLPAFSALASPSLGQPPLLQMR